MTELVLVAAGAVAGWTLRKAVALIRLIRSTPESRARDNEKRERVLAELYAKCDGHAGLVVVGAVLAIAMKAALPAALLAIAWILWR